MSKHLSILLLLLLLCVAGMNKGFAYDFSKTCSTGQTLYYNITDATNHYVEITCPGDPGADDPWEGYTKPTGNITLPSSVTYNNVTYAVKAIGYAAFDGCSGLTGSLTFPNSVTSIGSWAFHNCSGFTGSLTIPNSVTTIGGAAFYFCSGFTGSLTIPNSVTTIGGAAFAECSGFTGSLTIPSSVTIIDDYVFYDCGGFTGSLTIPNSVTSIGYAAFYDCSGFTGSLTLSSSVTTIGEEAFYDCSGFTGSLTIPNSVTTIGDYAFTYCSGFTGSLTIGNSVTSIGYGAFGACYGLTGSLTIPNSVTTIDDFAFYNCSSFTGSLTIGNSVTTIGDYAFFDCNGFTGSLILGNSVTTIGESAFEGCSGFTGSLNIPNSVTTIGDYAFTYCSGFTGSLTIGNSVTSIGNGAFSECDGFTGSLTIPNSVTTIGNYAFEYCSGFTGSLTFGGSLTSIGNSAFFDCYGLTGSLTIPNSVTTIGNYAFAYCTGFTGSLTIGNSVTSIGEAAFYECSGFTGSLTIGNSVTTIGEGAFTYCTGLSSIIVLPDMPPTLDTDAFNYVPTDTPVYVPCSALEDYQATEGWSAFTNLQCIPETLTVYDGTVTNNRIPAYIFYFDDFARSQFVIPAADLAEMTGRPISSMTFYTTTQNVPYTTVSDADVYLMEVDYTTIDAYEPKASATIVYSGRFNIVSAGNGGEMTIIFSTPYVYQGGNLLVGIDNTEDNDYKSIYFKGQTVSGASISGSNSSSTGTIPATQQNFIPKTSFVYAPSMCAPKTLPYTYGFEEEDEFDCWTMLNCHPITGRYSTSSYSTHQGDYGFRFRYNTNPPQYLVSPELESTTPMKVSFYYRNNSNSYPETFQVGYSTTTQSPTAFTWGDEVTAQNAGTWMLYEDYFPVGTKYVAVKYNSYDQWVLFLDDFSFTPAATCPAPTGLNVTDLMPSSATLNWTGTAENYHVHYRPTVGEMTTIFFDGFEEGFDNWTTIRNGGGDETTDWGQFDAINFGDESITNHNGNYVAMSRSWNTDPYSVDNWLITPQVTLNGTLSFWVTDDGQYHEHYEVWVSTTTNEISAFSLFYSPGNASDEWREVVVDLSSFNGIPGYIALRHTDYNQDFLLIDDFSITAFEGSGEWVTAPATGNSLALDGLDPETDYEWQVHADCEGWGIWSVSNFFQTLSNCAVPTGLDISSVMPDNATLTWEGVQEHYNLRWRTVAYADKLFTEDFENGLGNWTLVDCHANSGLNSTAHSGSNSFGFRWTTAPPQYLISPELSGIIADAELNFYYRNFSSSYPESFLVGYSTTTNDLDAFTWSEEITVPATTQWYLFEGLLLPESTKYIAIQCTSNDMYYLLIDDIVIYGEGHEAGEWLPVNAINPPFILNVNPEVLYEVQVQGVYADCEGGVTEWSDSYFLELPVFDMFITDGNWNVGSNWYTGNVPANGMDVTINANAVIPANYTANVSEVTVNEGASITLAEGGQLYHKTSGLVVTLQKHFDAYTVTQSLENYYLIGVPFNSSTAIPAAMTAPEVFDLYRFGQTYPNAEWRNHHVTPITSMAAGAGALYATSEDVDVEWTGPTWECNASNLGISVTYTANSNIFNGWMLMGNAFTCNGYIYFNNGTTIEPIEVMTYDANGQLITLPAGTPIAPLQGVFIKYTTSGRLLFSAEAPGAKGIGNGNFIDITKEKEDNGVLPLDDSKLPPLKVRK